jgi:hypothetical protein
LSQACSFESEGAPLDHGLWSKTIRGKALSNHPDLTIEPLDDRILATGKLKDVPADGKNLATLQAVFHHVPSLTQSAVSLTSKSYVIHMSAEAAKGLTDGSLNMMEAAGGGFYGSVVDAASGEIVENVSFVAKGVSKVAVAATIFQILAVATAQYYLPQINRRLAKVESGINDLREHLEAHDRAVLVGAVRHLRTMSAALEGRELDEADFRSELVGLDSTDRDCRRVLEANRENMRRYRRELDGIKLSAVLKPDFEAATEKAEQYERAALTSLQAAYVRTIVARFRCIVPSDYRLSFTQNTLRELSEDLDAMRDENGEFSKRFEERIKTETTATLDLDDLKELFGEEDTLEEKRREIVGEERGRRKAVVSMRDELDAVVRDVREQTARQISSGEEPLTLVVTLNDDNEIESLSELTA